MGGPESYSSRRFFVARFDLNFSKCLRFSSKSEIHKIRDIFIYQQHNKANLKIHLIIHTGPENLKFELMTYFHCHFGCLGILVPRLIYDPYYFVPGTCILNSVKRKVHPYFVCENSLFILETRKKIMYIHVKV